MLLRFWRPVRLPSSWAPPSFVRRRREPQLRTGGLSSMRDTPTQLSHAPTADALPGGWRIDSLWNTRDRPRRRTLRCTTSLARSPPPPPTPPPPPCPPLAPRP